jgi:orotidine-5'-phosphate decarboxylase
MILALDLTAGSDLNQFALRTISLLERYICAIKLNFHLILPLSSSELSEVNRHVHSYGLQSVADIKLNDVPSTNKTAISLLSSMGFDAITVNPFIGTAGLRAAVVQAHELKLGILALLYMSNIGAQQGFGINFLDSNGQVTLLYQKFLQDAITCRADGVIVGANRLEILREISCKEDRIPIYSPGLGVQGGNIKQAANNGTDYFIIGRSIIGSKDPLKTAKNLQQQLAHVNVDA